MHARSRARGRGAALLALCYRWLFTALIMLWGATNCEYEDSDSVDEHALGEGNDDGHVESDSDSSDDGWADRLLARSEDSLAESDLEESDYDRSDNADAHAATQYFMNMEQEFPSIVTEAQMNDDLRGGHAMPARKRKDSRSCYAKVAGKSARRPATHASRKDVR